MVLTRIPKKMMIFFSNTSAAIAWQCFRSWHIASCNSAIYCISSFHLVLIALASLGIVKFSFFRLAIFPLAFAIRGESTSTFTIYPLVFCPDCFSVFGSAILRKLHNATLSAHVLMSIRRCFPFVKLRQWQHLAGSFAFWIGATLVGLIKRSFGSRRVRGMIGMHQNHLSGVMPGTVRAVARCFCWFNYTSIIPQRDVLC